MADFPKGKRPISEVLGLYQPMETNRLFQKGMKKIRPGRAQAFVVLSTLRRAFDLDFRILVAGDCCADPR
jgi:hypothetical protein